MTVMGGAIYSGDAAVSGAEDASSTEPFQLEGHLFFWMTKVMGMRDRQLAGELRRFGLRVPEWRIIALLQARQSLSIGEAATITGLDHTTMSRIVDRMADNGRLLRLADANDLRVTRLAATALGSALFKQAWPTVARLNNEALARLPTGSLPLLCLALDRISAAMEESWTVKGGRRTSRAG